MVRLRSTQPNLVRPYRVWAYPVTPAIYVGLSLWTLGTLVRERPFESFAGLGTVVVGALVWRVAQRGVPVEVAAR
jgi:APA family basic amino acid/polyamine antiporter